MRKSSYLFLAMALLTPLATAWLVQREAVRYRNHFGVEAEGMGFFAIVAGGALVSFSLFLVAAACASSSYRRLYMPRPRHRKIELALFCMAPALVVLFVYFGLLGGPYPPPQRILVP